MGKSRQSASKPYSKREIASLAKKLEKWGESLPATEEALLQLIVSRAEVLNPESVLKLQIQDSLFEATRSIFEKFKGGAGKGAWVKIHPIWYKETPGLDDYEIVTKASIKKKR